MSNLRYTKRLHGLRQIVKFTLSKAFPLIKRIYKFPNVLSIDETLDKLYTQRCSISRFGDGEFLYIIDKLSLPFQKYDSRLANKLAQILVSKNENILVALPIGYNSLNELTDEGKLFWRAQITWIYPRLKKHLLKDKIYYNAHMSRVYITIKDKDRSSGYFQKLMKLWSDRDVVIIEGEKSRLGVGNNLFGSAKSVRRILAPAQDAFSCYDSLLSFTTENISKEVLILIALGPTATALAYDLSLNSFQAIDIGNVDIEYEWFLQGAKRKVRIPYKYTSEAAMGRDVENCENPQYLSEIIARFDI